MYTLPIRKEFKVLCLILKPKKPGDTDCVSGKEEEIVPETEARWQDGPCIQVYL